MRSPAHRAGASVVATLVVLLPVLGVAAPAHAGGAYCSGAGVNVVVDYHQLGGGVQRACDPDGAGEAGSSVFPHAGVALTYAQRDPGFVCRVAGSPQSDPCTSASPPDAYWALYWSDGDGSWHYASQGVGSTSVGDGGFLAFSWQGSSTKTPPGAAPVNDQPTADPSGSGGSGGSGSGGSGSSGGHHGAQPGTPSAPPATATSGATSAGSHQHRRHHHQHSRQHSRHRQHSRQQSQHRQAHQQRHQQATSTAPSPSPPAAASPTPTSGAASAADPPRAVAARESALPGWVPVAVLAALLASGGLVVRHRRRRETG